MVRLNLDTTSTIKFRWRFRSGFFKVLKRRRVVGWITFGWLCGSHEASVVKRWAVQIHRLILYDCLELLWVMPQSGVHTLPRGLNGFEIEGDIIWLILFHLALSTNLVDLRHIPGWLLNELPPILLAWLFCHECRGSCQMLLLLLQWVNYCTIDFSIGQEGHYQVILWLCPTCCTWTFGDNSVFDGWWRIQD